MEVCLAEGYWLLNLGRRLDVEVVVGHRIKRFPLPDLAILKTCLLGVVFILQIAKRFNFFLKAAAADVSVRQLAVLDDDV